MLAAHLRQLVYVPNLLQPYLKDHVALVRTTFRTIRHIRRWCLPSTIVTSVLVHMSGEVTAATAVSTFSQLLMFLSHVL